MVGIEDREELRSPGLSEHPVAHFSVPVVKAGHIGDLFLSRSEVRPQDIFGMILRQIEAAAA